MFALVDWASDSLHIDGLVPLFIGSLLIAIVAAIVSAVFDRD